MFKRTFSGLMIVLLFFSVIILAFNVRPANADAQTVYINADGSVTPAGAPIVTSDKITYNFAGNISYPTYSGIIVQRSNVIIDGKGYVIQGNQNGNGLDLTGISNVTIKNTNIENFATGINLFASFNSIIGNNITGNEGGGISLYFSSGNNISGNNITANNTGYIPIAGIYLSYSCNNIIIRNNLAIYSNICYGDGGIALYYYSNNNNMSGNTITDAYYGIDLSSSSNNSMNDNNIANNVDGIRARASNNNISGNNIADNYVCGIIVGPSGNSITGNNITGNEGDGIELSSDNSVCGNNVADNWLAGIHIYSNNSTIIGNNITKNRYGIYLSSSPDNMIYHNNFINNTSQVSSDGSANVWDNGYPSGGNYWSDYNGTDFHTGPYQNETGCDGIGDTPYTIDQNNTDSYPLRDQWSPQDLAVAQLVVWYSSTSFVNISATVENNGNKIETANLRIYANNNTIWSQSFSLAPGSNKTLSAIWNTAGYCGQYQITAYVDPVEGEINLSNNKRTDGYVNIWGKGYFILAAGNYYGNLLSTINYGCNQVYKVLRAVGYSADDIYYLNQQQLGNQDVDGDGHNDIDAWSSSANLEYAIETWARYRVSPGQPLFIYLFDHGGVDRFAINDSVFPYTDEVTSTQLASWISNLQNTTGSPVHVIYAACHSGSFIDELSKKGDITVTSCLANESSWLGPGGKWEAFSIPFWNDIRSGRSIGQAFKDACIQINNFWYWGLVDWIRRWWNKWYQTPVLDDPSSIAGSTHIGACEWPYPYIDSVMPRLYSSWPPSSNITLWTKVENTTNLMNVTAWMLPPDLAPPNSTDTLLSLDLECYEMNDPSGDGNWTVCIPAANFTNHASAPANFTFFITAEEENGDIATPSMITVQFTETGEPPPDNVAPIVHIERPLENSALSGIISVNGTVSDDVCMDRVEAYVDGSLAGTISLPPTSTSFFELPLDTTLFSNGNHTILVNAFDKSGNSDNETITVFVQNFVHDVAVTEVATSKTVSMQGYASNIGVTIANHGSYLESFNLSIYANETCITMQTVTLSSQNFTTLNFAWNNSGFAPGSYVINAYAEPVLNDTNQADNNYTGSSVFISIAGDLTGGTSNPWDFVPDGKCDGKDIAIVAICYGSAPGCQPPWIWNPNCDVNGDGKIDGKDIALVALHFGQAGP